MKKETVTTAATVTIGFGIAFLIVGTSETFQSCIGEHYHHESSETLKEGLAQFLIMFKVGSGCSGEFVHKNAEAIIALFTVILGIATWLLWRATRALVIGAEDTSKRQLRAYVIIQGTRFEIKNNRFISHFIIKNTGQTPAHNLRTISNTCVLLHPLSKEFDFSIPEPGEPSVGLLGASQEVASASSLGPSDTRKEEFDEASSDEGWLRIYTYGTVSYFDIFNDPQWTNFCFYFQWTHNEIEATANEDHNDAS
jgi:hypothetical protein